MFVELREGHVIEDSACSAQTGNVAGIVELMKQIESVSSLPIQINTF